MFIFLKLEVCNVLLLLECVNDFDVGILVMLVMRVLLMKMKMALVSLIQVDVFQVLVLLLTLL